jgi:hypothetical protein
MNNFPLIHLIALVVGGIILFMVKRKYKKIRIIEMVGIFILYFILVTLFTEPVKNLARKLISLIQLQ